MTEKPLINLGPHPGPNAALQRDVIKLEAAIAKLQKRVAELEFQLGSTTNEIRSIKNIAVEIRDLVRLASPWRQ